MSPTAEQYAAGEAVLSPVLNDAVTSSADDARRGGDVGGLQTLERTANAIPPAFPGVVPATVGFTSLDLTAAEAALVYRPGVILAVVERRSGASSGTSTSDRPVEAIRPESAGGVENGRETGPMAAGGGRRRGFPPAP